MTTGCAVNVRDYGAVGDGITDDSAAFQAAIDAALAGPKTVFVPPGNYLVPATLTVPGSLAFRGAGRGFTTITHPTASNGFTVTAPNGSTVELADFTLQGPTGLGFDNGCLGISFVVGWGFDTRFSVRRVAVLGTFDHAIMRSGGGIFDLDDCHLEGSDVAAAAFEGTNTPDSMFVTARGCTFTTPNGDLSSQGSVGLYIHPHVPFTVSDCRFAKLGRYGIYENGSPTAPRRPALVSNCQFVDCEMIQSKNNGRTVLSGCSVKGTSSGLGSTIREDDTLFDGCTFDDAGPVTVNNGATFHGCTIVNTRIVLANGTVTPAGQLLQLSGCRFRTTSYARHNGKFVHSVGSAAQRLVIDGCEFYDTTTTGNSDSIIGVENPAADVRITGSRFRYRSNNGWGVLMFRGARLVLEGCEFDGRTGGGVAAINTAAVGVLEGGNNTFLGAGACYGGYASTTAQQRLTRRAGVNPAPVPSAATIDTNTAAWLSYDTHIVTGTATIVTLGSPWVAVGPVRLVVAAGASWSTASSGNIAPSTTAPRTPGAVVTLLWEPTAAKWLEV